MARPTRQGIDYFPLDVEFDDKTEMYLIEKEAIGLAVLISVWQLIYKNQGYYIKCNNDLCLLIKKRISADINSINDCINSAVDRNIFDKELFAKEGILTSKALQKRFFEAAKRKKQVVVFSRYLLIDTNCYNNLVYVNINSVNADNNTTNVKEEVNVNVKVNVKEEVNVKENVNVKEEEETFVDEELTNQKTIEKTSKKIFRPPELSEIIDFFTINGSTKAEAELFFYHYDGKDWMVQIRDGPQNDIKQSRKWQNKAMEWIKRKEIQKIEQDHGGKPNGKIFDLSLRRTSKGATPEELARIASEWP